eukprot:NODE_6838_length_1633_cov_6.104250.p1 GENE.NODE_6838_length_1633_cov_6.104250~~NODE_6838_length_1633_cov_6.104250.p1  ORF type:complete len:468 (-),score=120.05 NODE_6838_length_1633_cov_6.104250:229-1554(-)
MGTWSACAAIVLVYVLQPRAVAALSCWAADFTHEACCGKEYGPLGNRDCWDATYTAEACCGEGGAHCDSPYFHELRDLALDYYETNRLTVQFIMRWPRILGAFDEVYTWCAAAALQSLLLLAEEEAPQRPQGYGADQLATYTLHLQRSFEDGLLTPEMARYWPLDTGVERVLELERRRGAEQAAILSQEARRRPRGFVIGGGDVALIVSYCNEDLAWMNATLPPRLLRGIDLVVVNTCPGNDGLNTAPHPWAWRSREGLVGVTRGRECAAYLSYLSERHDGALPRQMVFIRGDALEHLGVEEPHILVQTLRALAHGADIPFAHLGLHRVSTASEEIGALWPGLFGEVAPQPLDLRTYCCSHFVVSRERALLRPRQFYADALRHVLASGAELAGADVCEHISFLWHVIFGEHPYLPHRARDPGLPLFLKRAASRDAPIRAAA